MRERAAVSGPLPGTVWYSGSSEPSPWLVNSNISGQSSCGMPIIEQITANGRSAATSVTKSHEPRGATSSMICVVISRTLGSSRAVARGVKPLLTSRRSRTWRGGSVIIIIFPAPTSVDGSSGLAAIEMPCCEL